MKIKVKRITPIDYPYTIGKMYIDGDYFCDTLEDRVRDIDKNGKFDNGEVKVAGETAIPYGRYQVVVTMSPKFKRELPRLLNVPNFEGILIHRGNTDKDSAGCLLLGENKVKGKVINSTPYEQKLVSILKDVQNKGEEIWITIE
jgi:hypothetical protein